MATKLYLTGTTYSPTPTTRGTWAGTSPSGGVKVIKLLTTPEGSNISSGAEGLTTNGELIFKAVSEPLAAQTISGTWGFAVRGQAASGNSGMLKFHAYVMDSEGSVRGTLVSNYSLFIEGITFNATARGLDSDWYFAGSPPSVTTVNAQSGDRIVVEMGHVVSTGDVITTWVGGTGTGLVYNNTDINNSSWFSLSDDITFGGAAFRAFILE